MKSSRRDFIRQTAIAGAGIAMLGGNLTSANTLSGENTQFILPVLPYNYDALEPFIDKQTMELHHSKHHQAYIDKLNKAIVDKNLGKVTLEGLLKEISKHDVLVRNNAGGHYNHNLFWGMMKPQGNASILSPGTAPAPQGKLADAIKSTWGSVEDFKTKFSDAAKTVFGSGWAWLIRNKEDKLEIGTTPNQDNPIMDLSPLKGKPILGLDVWEHAYYLKYQNKRADYIMAWWNVVNWGEAAGRFEGK